MSRRALIGLVVGLVGIASVVILLATSGGTRQDPTKQLAIAYALGGKGDQSYNDAAASGSALLKQRGYEVTEHEPPSLDQYREGLEVLAQRKPRVVFCVGYLYDDHVRSVAPRYPDTAFVVLDGGVEADNVWSIKFRADEGSELAGAAAASLTKTNKVAFIGGMNIPAINEFKAGYEKGAKATKNNVEVMVYYVASTPAGFTDPVKGKEIALTAIAAGADVVFHAAGTSGNGVIEACATKGALAIGVDVDQRHLAPNTPTVVTSVVKKFDVAMSHFVSEYTEKKLQKGSFLTLGLKAGAIDVTPIDRPEWAEAKARIEERRRDLLAREK
jgi:basic membrane protein A